MDHYKLPVTESKEEFLRGAYVNLYSSPYTVETIDKATVSEVEQHTVHGAHGSYRFNFDYTAEIGYNRNEVYIEEEKYKAVDGLEHTRRVPKNRTVIDWQPYAGHAQDVYGEGWACVGVDGNSNFYGQNFEGIYLTDEQLERLIQKAEKIEGQTELSKERERSLKVACLVDAQLKVEKELPGDAFRNLEPECSFSDEDSYGFCDTYFEGGIKKVEFSVSGQKPIVVTRLDSDFRRDNLEEQNNSAAYTEYFNTINEQYHKEKQATETSGAGSKYASMRRVTLILFVAAFIMLILPGGFPPFVVKLLISALCIVAGIVVAKRSESAVNELLEARKNIYEKYNALRVSYWDDIQNTKKELLEKRFASMGWAPLTEREQACFVLTEERKESLADKFIKKLTQGQPSSISHALDELEYSKAKKKK